jgi:endonuclease/exonuclease/phosphatase family metal-dependent hydrolase
MGADLLRIVSYNVRYFGHALRGLASTQGSKRQIAEGLSKLDPLPDVVCMQEVETISMRASFGLRKRDPNETQLEAFMTQLETAFERNNRRMPYEAFYFRAHSYKFGDMMPVYTTGLAVIVNVDTVKVDSHNVEKPEHITHHHVERWKDRKQSRICAHMRLCDRDGRPFHIFNTHLSLPTPFVKEFWTQKAKMGFGVNQLHEAQRLVTFIRKHVTDGDSFLVCGDFNSPPGSPVYKYLTDEIGLIGAQAALKQVDPRSPRGFPTAGFMHLRMHLDHIFSGGPVVWADCEGTRCFGDPECLFHGCSDHVPIIARFRLEGSSPRQSASATEQSAQG